MIGINNDCLDTNQSLGDLHKIGQVLKQKRESQNISIEDLAKNLRLGAEQITALEQGNVTLLPEEVFIKGMIKRISEKLKLDPKILLEEIKPSNEINNSLNDPNIDDTKTASEILFSEKKVWLSLLTLLLLIFVSFLNIYLKKSSQNNIELQNTKTDNIIIEDEFNTEE
tara:strand:+ start:1632 stop:2138 length:507 start_codon:yes stop_codon:yes gene_type:complete